MRSWITVAPLLLLIAAPLQAQPADADIWDDDPFAGEDEAVMAVDRLVGALLDLRVGRLARAFSDVTIEGNIRENDTVRDLMTREDPAIEEKIRGGARAMTGLVTSMMREFSTLLPELEAMGEQMREAMPE
jgi:hypothetical protein